MNTNCLLYIKGNKVQEIPPWFSDAATVRILVGSIPGWRTKILHAVQRERPPHPHPLTKVTKPNAFKFTSEQKI